MQKEHLFKYVVIGAICFAVFFLLYQPMINTTDVTPKVERIDCEKHDNAITPSSQSHRPTNMQQHIRELYIKYKADLIKMRHLAKEFCQKTTVPAGWAHVYHCLYGMAESELTYLRIRELKPKNILELSSAVGYSTLWMLQAMEDNGGDGVLYSMDVYPTPFPIVLSTDIQTRRWRFNLGDATQTITQLDHIDFDYIFIDTMHTKQFAKWYTKAVLEKWGKRKPSVFASVHDVYEATDDLAPEGQIVIEWLAYSQIARNVFTLNSNFNPHFWKEYQAIREEVLGKEEADAKLGAFNDDLRVSVFFEMNYVGRDCTLCVEFS